uniref:Uncharacterized protein n=1 Tax=Proboscia inermis TaxID=420281 RepID=A0A7S0GAG9_9STRA|mmetsp:Transcript_12210/g.12268  ORF Transcript_12210/g.12268 Transcript_12210/m.12268 type:complete len:172 (+) Transcript_12210:45-560(+)
MVSIKDTSCRRSTQTTRSAHTSRIKQKYIAAAALVIFFVMILAQKSFKRKQKQSDQTSLSNHKKSHSTAAMSAKAVDVVFLLNSSSELGSMLVVPLKSETTIIRYQHIPEKSIRQNHVRYAAFYQDAGHGEDELWKPLSVRSWLEILSSDNKNFESAALQFSNEIKKVLDT